MENRIKDKKHENKKAKRWLNSALQCTNMCVRRHIRQCQRFIYAIIFLYCAHLLPAIGLIYSNFHAISISSLLLILLLLLCTRSYLFLYVIHSDVIHLRLCVGQIKVRCSLLLVHIQHCVFIWICAFI